MPRFRQNYVRAYTHNWDILLRKLGWDSNEEKTVIETGSYEGSSALYFLDNWLNHSLSKLICIDSWEGLTEQFKLFSENIDERTDRNKIRVIKLNSFEALNVLVSEGVKADLVYIDGSHAAPHVLSDLVLSFNLCRVGGLIICDDYLWADPRYGGADILGRPKLAIDAFTTIFSRKIEIMMGFPIYQIIFTKKSDL